MTITNVSKPTTTLANTIRVVSYETWDTNTTTWDTEVRTWDSMSSNMTNNNRVSASITNISKPS